MKQRKIQTRAYPASAKGNKGVLLFVHGAYVNSTCWGIHFIPYFQRHGYDCHTVDLSGHGDSEGREHIDDFGLDDYVDDLRYAASRIGGPVIIIGHSMGARVLERYLEKNQAQAAIFLSPVPTTGTASSALQLSLRYPTFFQVLDDAVNGNVSDEVGELMTKVYFSPQVSAEEALEFLPMVGPESCQAVVEMSMPDSRWSVTRCKLPALVMGGVEDAVFPPSMLHYLASNWNAEVHKVKDAGHMLMLDPQWQDAADYILGWLARKV